MKKNYSTGIYLLLLAFVCLQLAACSKMDEYRKYAEGGEIAYAGKLDSLKIYSGRNRVLVKGLFIADPNIVSCKIYWDSRKDSVLVPVARTHGVDTLSQLIENLEEGVHSFEVVTYDTFQRKSVIVNGTGTAYGERYQAFLINRPVNNSELDGSAKTSVSWGGMDLTSGVFASDVTFTDTFGVLQTVRVPIAIVDTVLKPYKYGTTFTYRTLFLPDSLSIDTFYTGYQTVNVLMNVTKQYLANTGGPFNYSSWDAKRWGILANWTTNSPVKNASGYGGYELRSNVGVLSFEAGWGLPNVTEGKIYQTVTLPPGKYVFEAVVDACSSSGAMYVVAALGTALPDITTFTASPPLGNIAFVTPGTKQVSFTLPDEQVVTLGLAATLAGNSSTGQYCKVTAVRLKFLKLE
ncbi:protein of unknown function [Filimonas lacunae]|uniref:DUF5013 domain-containing protein n=1 Tax=Filimonas lacunae TaxID=477680 RepID=A0A173MPZ8_9BACT|nr:DUF4998 domain-containing protein [Filimonas lacunae]BAV09461.1 hypothetical protein FLA_5510 [Filimonas lacunae]SIS73596.1 protein of unknown function [Filimonas lacunae]